MNINGPTYSQYDISTHSSRESSSIRQGQGGYGAVATGAESAEDVRREDGTGPSRVERRSAKQVLEDEGVANGVDEVAEADPTVVSVMLPIRHTEFPNFGS
jgi:hypothetical protein